jgi:hypothetical protein
MNPYFIAGSVLAVVFAYGAGHWQGDEAGQAKVQAQWDKEKAKLAEEYAANARNTALLNSLQHRPNRTENGGVSTTASNGKDGCTGKELYREDGAVLIGIAREADELRASLKQCYAQYETARKELNK